MVVENGGLVLLESAVDDTTSVISHNLLPAITELIENEQVEAKKAKLQSIKELDEVIKGLLTGGDHDAMVNLFSTLTSLTQTHVSTSHDKLQQSLSNIVSSKLREGLSDPEVNQIEDEHQVITAMHRVRDSIHSAALTEMKSEWLILSSTTRRMVADQLRKAFSDTIASFLSSISKIKGREKDSDILMFMEDLSSTIPVLLTAASDSSDSLAPIFKLPSNR